MQDRIRVAIESSPKRTFATAIDWPGWSRSGRTEADALEALAAYALRYAPIALAAGDPLPAHPAFEVDERHEGGGGTEFGVPSRVTDADARPLTRSEAERRAHLVEAAWAAFDAMARDAPESLRKGPRGGGRDTSKIVEHVHGADHAYAREMGIKIPPPDPAAPGSVARMRTAMLEVLREPSDGSPLAGRRWTSRYAAHRIAWHALDHAWEIEDRRTP